MAAEITDHPRTRKRRTTFKADGVPRLRHEHERDLDDVCRAADESLAGLRTRYLPTVASDYDDVRLYDQELFIEHEAWGDPRWRARLARSRRAIAAMRTAGLQREASILHVHHGHPDPIVRQLAEPVRFFLGDLASLARYTDVVEERRAEMARGDLRGLLSRDSKRPRELAAVIDLSAARERAAWLDRAITSGDALRAACADYPERPPVRMLGEDKSARAARMAPWDARRSAHDARRTAFMVRARGEAALMLQAAHEAYTAFWRSART